jgi:predicted peroxiredoxin
MAKKIFTKSTWGSEDPTRAAMIFGHSNVLVKAGNEVVIFLLGDAVVLVREAVRNAVFPVGWPPLSEQWKASLELGIRIEICDACRLARGVTDEEIVASGAVQATPENFVAGIEWADLVISEG